MQILRTILILPLAVICVLFWSGWLASSISFGRRVMDQAFT